jgi:hypothetical protein
MTKKTQKVAVSDKLKELAAKDPKAFRQTVGAFTEIPLSPKARYKRGSDLCQKLSDNTALSDDERKEFSDIVLSINTTSSHRLLMETMRENTDRTAIAEFADDLIEEYDCKTASERSLCEVVALSYFAIMKASRQFAQAYTLEYLSNEKNGFYGLVSKELEKQNRTYLNALQTLRALKSPL